MRRPSLLGGVEKKLTPTVNIALRLNIQVTPVMAHVWIFYHKYMCHVDNIYGGTLVVLWGWNGGTLIVLLGWNLGTLLVLLAWNGGTPNSNFVSPYNRPPRT
jgi:hypothetical protein